MNNKSEHTDSIEFAQSLTAGASPIETGIPHPYEKRDLTAGELQALRVQAVTDSGAFNALEAAGVKVEK